VNGYGAATGLNYKKHIEESKMKPPTEPEAFPETIGSLADLSTLFPAVPIGGEKLDWETELAVVMAAKPRTSQPPRRPTNNLWLCLHQ